MCFTKALDLLEYWRREHAKQNQPAAPQGKSWTPESIADAAEKFPWSPISENVAEGQFHAMQSMMTTPAGASAEVSRIPEHLREAIRWAEQVKKERGLA